MNTTTTNNTDNKTTIGKEQFEAILGKPYLNIYLTNMTEEEIRRENREYNPSEWDKTISRFIKYDEVQFYKLPKGNGYEYDRYYAVYTTNEGIRFMNSVSYSSCLNSTGLCEVAIDPFGGLRRYFFGDGEKRADKGSAKNRTILAQMSKQRGCIFTSQF